MFSNIYLFEFLVQSTLKFVSTKVLLRSKLWLMKIILFQIKKSDKNRDYFNR